MVAAVKNMGCCSSIEEAHVTAQGSQQRDEAVPTGACDVSADVRPASSAAKLLDLNLASAADLVAGSIS